MRSLWRKPIDDVMMSLGHLADAPSPGRSMALVVVALVVTWFVYVPIHELLHVAGCVAPGGAVSRLEIAPQYGGAILSRWLPFVVSGGEYAGRLSGFDTRGSDLIYLATDFAPFVLSIVIGVPLLAACARRRRPVLMGAGIVVGLAPFYNLIGDYYEMGSIITTRAATLAAGRTQPVAFEGLRSDDVFKLLGTLCTDPATLGLDGPVRVVAGGLLILVGLIVGLVLAFGTYWLGHVLARLFGFGSRKRSAIG